MKQKLFIICIVFSIFFGKDDTSVYAASLRPTIMESKEGVTTVGIFLDPQGEAINALSGVVHYDPTVFAVRAIRTTDSIVSLWIDQPKDNPVGTIKYSGVVAGGFDGVRSPLTSTIAPGVIFKLIVTPLVSGSGVIRIDDIDIRLSDGAATKANVTTTPLTLSVDDRYAKAIVAPEPAVTPSEAHLIATLVHDDTTQNKWAVAFTVDTNRVSLDRYEIAESYHKDPLTVGPSVWKPAESPYVLRDQYRSHYIHIRAIAQNGEVYVTTIAPIDFSTAATWFTWSILILISTIVLVAIARRIIHRKHTHHAHNKNFHN